MADLVVVKDGEIVNLQNQTMRHINLIRKLQMSNQELRAFGCMCVVGNVSVGDLEWLSIIARVVIWKQVAWNLVV